MVFFSAFEWSMCMQVLIIVYRLSKLLSQKLTDNNPNIADLSDKNRPTKLAERYTELYDNQWTNAFEKLDTNQEQDTIASLKAILLVCGWLWQLWCFLQHIATAITNNDFCASKFE